MQSSSFHYDAFISYRHLDRDSAVVRKVQRLLERYKSPCEGRHIARGKRIARLFTDVTEFPMSPDLGKSIRDALDNSRFLLVIASEEYLQSKWCMAEIRHFLKTHNGSADNILFIRLSEDPTCIRRILAAASPSPEEDIFTEPLYIDAYAPTTKASLRIVRREYLRLAAALIGCGYDQLAQRHKRRSRSRLAASLIAVCVLAAVVGLIIKAEVDQKIRSDNYREMDSRISLINTLAAEGDAVHALAGMQQLHETFGSHPEYGGYLRSQLRNASVSANYIPAFSAFSKTQLASDTSTIFLSGDQAHILSCDVPRLRSDQTLHIEIFDPFLNKEAEALLPTGELSENIANGLSHDCASVDYLQEDNTFILTILPYDTGFGTPVEGVRLVYAADGSLISREETLPEAPAFIPTAAQQALYDVIADNELFDLPLMTQEGVYGVASFSGDEIVPFTYDADAFYLAFIPHESTTVSLLAQLMLPSDLHMFEYLYPAPGGQHIVVICSRGIYESQITIVSKDNPQDCCRFDTDISGVTPNDVNLQHYAERGLMLLTLNANHENTALFSAFLASPGSFYPDYEDYAMTGFIFDALTAEHGVAYLLDDTGTLTAVTLDNMCLSDQLCSADGDIPVREAWEDNALIDEPDSFSPSSTGSMGDAVWNGLTISPGLDRPDRSSPTNYSGVDIGIGFLCEDGTPFVEFYALEFNHPYYCREDQTFGMINYGEGSGTQLFRLYDYDALMTQLSALPL